MAKKRFRPRLLPLGVTVLMLAVLFFLGFWQMTRSSQKQALINSYKAAPELPVVGLERIPEDWLAFRFRKIELRGKYDVEHQLLLENQVHNGQPGYMVLTPFKLQENGSYVLVNRGWLSESPDRMVLPEVEVDVEPRTIQGLLNHPPGVGIKMGSLDDSRPGWPKAVPYLDNDWVALQLAADIKPWVVLLSDDEPDGFVRQWRPSVRMTPEKHMGYAFQWFSLAVALIFLYIIASLKSVETDSGLQVSSQSMLK